MGAPTAAHPIPVAAAVVADGVYPDLTVGSFVQGIQQGLTFRTRAPSIDSHGTNAGTLLVSYVARPNAAPVAPAIQSQWRLQTRRITDFAPLPAWDSLGVPGPCVWSPGSVDFRYRDWLSPLVLGVDINLVAGDYFEIEIYRETPIADDLPAPNILYAVNFAWLAA